MNKLNTCKHCKNSCKDILCNKFELQSLYVDLKKQEQLIYYRKEELFQFLKTTMHSYITRNIPFYEPTNFTLYYSIDQDQFLRKNKWKYDEHAIGNWIIIDFAKSILHYLKTNYITIGNTENNALFEKMCSEAFEKFWKENSTKQIKALGLF
jgi:hypothetical protein